MMTITRNVVVLTSHESLHARLLASGNANFDHNSVLIKGGNAHHAHDDDNGYDDHIYDDECLDDDGHDEHIYDDDIHDDHGLDDGGHDDSQDGDGDVLVLTSGNLLHAQMRPLSNMQIVTITQS